MSDTAVVAVAVKQDGRSARPQVSADPFWFAALCGTAVAGCIFGGLLSSLATAEAGVFSATVFGIVGAVAGLFAAGCLAIPVAAVVALLAWALRIGPHRADVAITTGAVTLILTASPFLNIGLDPKWRFTPLFAAAPVLAAVIGSLTAWGAAARWGRTVPKKLTAGSNQDTITMPARGSLLPHLLGLLMLLLCCIAAYFSASAIGYWLHPDCQRRDVIGNWVSSDNGCQLSLREDSTFSFDYRGGSYISLMDMAGHFSLWFVPKSGTWRLDGHRRQLTLKGTEASLFSDADFSIASWNANELVLRLGERPAITISGSSLVFGADGTGRGYRWVFVRQPPAKITD